MKINKPNRVIVHCSDTPDKPKGSQGWDSVDRDIIDQWHKERGWTMIGYHYVIKKSGLIEIGRKEDQIGSHCQGQNTNSLGICLVGRAEFLPEQYDSLYSLYLQFKNKYAIDASKWTGHYESQVGGVRKTCPNINMQDLRKTLAAL